MGPSQTLVIRTSYHKLNILGSMGLHAVTHHDADHFRVFDTDLITSAAVAQRGADRGAGDDGTVDRNRGNNFGIEAASPAQFR